MARIWLLSVVLAAVQSENVCLTFDDVSLIQTPAHLVQANKMVLPDDEARHAWLGYGAGTSECTTITSKDGAMTMESCRASCLKDSTCDYFSTKGKQCKTCGKVTGWSTYAMPGTIEYCKAFPPFHSLELCADSKPRDACGACCSTMECPEEAEECWDGKPRECCKCSDLPDCRCGGPADPHSGSCPELPSCDKEPCPHGLAKDECCACPVCPCGEEIDEYGDCATPACQVDLCWDGSAKDECCNCPDCPGVGSKGLDNGLNGECFCSGVKCAVASPVCPCGGERDEYGDCATPACQVDLCWDGSAKDECCNCPDCPCGGSKGLDNGLNGECFCSGV